MKKMRALPPAAVGPLTILSVAILTLTACWGGSESPNYPMWTSPTRSPAAPPITRQLNATDYLMRPCDLVSQNKLRELGFGNPPYYVSPDLLYSECSWTDGNPESLDSKKLELRLHGDKRRPGEGSLLEELYQGGGISPHHAGDTHETFEPVTISGQPAIVMRSELPQPLNCHVAVGLSSGQGRQQGLEIMAIAGKDHGDPCSSAVGAAETAVRQMGG
jgi:hypothetical protein